MASTYDQRSTLYYAARALYAASDYDRDRADYFAAVRAVYDAASAVLTAEHPALDDAPDDRAWHLAAGFNDHHGAVVVYADDTTWVHHATDDDGTAVYHVYHRAPVDNTATPDHHDEPAVELDKLRADLVDALATFHVVAGFAAFPGLNAAARALAAANRR